MNRVIGEGAFGKVYSGRLLKQALENGKARISSRRKTDKKEQEMKMGLNVAVKMLQSMIWLCTVNLVCYLNLKNSKTRCNNISSERYMFLEALKSLTKRRGKLAEKASVCRLSFNLIGSNDLRSVW